MPSERTGELDGALIVCVGSRRSGTNWLQRVIASHPEVVDVPAETYLFSRGLAPLLERFQHASPGSRTVSRLYAERGRLLGAVRHLCDEVLAPYLERSPADTTRLLERTPEHVHHLGLIAELYPATRFVHIIRDPYEVTRSLLQQSWGPDTAAAAATEWRDAVTAGRRQGRGVDHYIEVDYQRLADDTAGVVARLFEQLDLAVTPRVIEHAVTESGRLANTAGRPPQAGRLSRRQRRSVRRVVGDLADETAAAESKPSGDARQATDAPARAVIPSIHHAQLAVDEFIEGLRSLRPLEDLDPLVEDDVRLRVLDGDTDRDWHGASRLGEFLAVARGDPVLGWEQRRSDVHPSDALFVVVSTFVSPQGQSADRVVVVRLGRGGIAEVLVYRFPVGGGVTAVTS